MTLDDPIIRASLRRHWSREIEIELFTELDSTSKHLVRRLSLDEPPPDTVLCIAAHQSAGVGRRGKTWYSPVDSITISLLRTFRQPASMLMGLSLVAGIAIAEALEAVVDMPVQLKWPNDIIVGDCKLAGILLEIPTAHVQETRVVTGIGINYRSGPEHRNIDQPFVVLEALASALPERNLLLGDVAGRVLEAYDQFDAQGWPVFAARWQARDYLAGKAVTVHQSTAAGQLPQQGLAMGVDNDGGLQVDQGAGPVTYYSGEVSVRPDWKSAR